MKRFQAIQYTAAAVACLGLMMPSRAMAADAGRMPAQTGAAQTGGAQVGDAQAGAAQPQANPTAPILDVRLDNQGTLTGQVLDAQGSAVTSANVVVRHDGHYLARSVTDSEGNFAVHGLQGGVYELASSDGSGVFRVWTAQGSPPSTHSGVLIIAGQQVSRGQGCPGDCCPGACGNQCGAQCGNPCGNPCGNQCGNPCGNGCANPCAKPCWNPWCNPFGNPRTMYVVGTLVLVGAAAAVIAGSINNHVTQSAS